MIGEEGGTGVPKPHIEEKRVSRVEVSRGARE
jgi:hypothetical protein